MAGRQAADGVRRAAANGWRQRNAATPTRRLLWGGTGCDEERDDEDTRREADGIELGPEV